MNSPDCSAAGGVQACATMPEALYCPAPTRQPQEGASFLPGCCLSRCPFPSRSRKHCHPGLCCTPPAFLFLAQELASSFPWPAALAPGLSRLVRVGARPRSRGQSASLLFPVLSAALGRGPGVSRRCWAWEQHTGILGEGRQEGGKAEAG